MIAPLVLAMAVAAQAPPDPLGVEPTPARKALGRRLFFDPVLSEDGTVSCSTCHDPEKGWADGLPRAVGIRGQVGPLHTPSILNQAYSGPQFWDGRVEGLVPQALLPLSNPVEMGSPGNEAAAVRRLRADESYVREFQDAFGEPPSAILMATAIACFETGIVTRDVPSEAELSPDAQVGRRLFVTHCSRCHSGERFTDGDFHNNGASFGRGSVGRQEVTRRVEDRRKFKTPSLINVAATAPYMHDGSITSLREVLVHYNAGGMFTSRRRLNTAEAAAWARSKTSGVLVTVGTEIRPLGLTETQLGYLELYLREGLAPRRVPR